MKKCPKCSNTLSEQRKNGITVDACNSCSGIFLEFSELKHFIDSVNENEGGVKITEVDKGDFRKDHAGRNYTCASCGTAMHEREYNYGSGIHIDFCKGCGATFLGEGELQEILDHEYSRLHSKEGVALRKKLEMAGKMASREQEQELIGVSKIGKSPILYRLIGKFFG